MGNSYRIAKVPRPSMFASSFDTIDTLTIRDFELDSTRDLTGYMIKYLRAFKMQFGKDPEGICMGAKDWLDFSAETSEICKFPGLTKQTTFMGIPITILCIEHGIFFSTLPENATDFILEDKHGKA